MTRRQQQTHGGARTGAGRKSVFGKKAVAKPFAMDLTPEGRQALFALCARTGLSRNGVVGVLALQFADVLGFPEEGVVYPDKAQDVISIRVPKDAASKLRAARRRTGKGFSDIGEALIRQFGRKAKYPRPPKRSQTG